MQLASRFSARAISRYVAGRQLQQTESGLVT
jgi:hypothetical protein